MQTPGKKFSDLVEIEEIKDTDITVVRNETGVKKTPMQKISDYVKQKFIAWVFEDLPTEDKTIPGAFKELNSALMNKIVLGSDKNTTLIVTDQTLKFVGGAATVNLNTISSAYQKTTGDVIAQLKSASAAVITSANVSKNIATIKCSNLSGTPYEGEIAITLLIFMS